MGGVLGSASERKVKEREPGFSEADQEGLYHLVNVSSSLVIGMLGHSPDTGREQVEHRQDTGRAGHRPGSTRSVLWSRREMPAEEEQEPRSSLKGGGNRRHYIWCSHGAAHIEGLACRQCLRGSSRAQE